MTPSSKVVGDLALQLVAAGADPKDFAENPQNYDIPDSVIGFLGGELGDPPGGWPEPFRSKALKGRAVPKRDVELSDEDSAALDDKGRMRQTTLNRLLFPGPTKEFTEARETYGQVGRLNTLDYLYGLRPGDEHTVRIGKGVSLILGLEAIGRADERGMRTVMCTINGQLRPIRVRDKSVTVDIKAAEKADPNNSGPRRRAVRRRRHGDGRGGRRGRGGRHRRHHRGHEDGGRDHRAHRRNGPAARPRLDPASRRRRSGPGHRVLTQTAASCC